MFLRNDFLNCILLQWKKGRKGRREERSSQNKNKIWGPSFSSVFLYSLSYLYRSIYIYVERERKIHVSVQFSLVAQSCPTLSDPMHCSTPGFSVHHQLPELVQTHVHRVGDAIQPSHSLSSPSLAFNISQHQGRFKWVSFSHQVTKVLVLQLQHQSFQWIFRTDLL